MTVCARWLDFRSCSFIQSSELVWFCLSSERETSSWLNRTEVRHFFSLKHVIHPAGYITPCVGVCGGVDDAYWAQGEPFWCPTAAQTLLVNYRRNKTWPDVAMEENNPRPTGVPGSNPDTDYFPVPVCFIPVMTCNRRTVECKSLHPLEFILPFSPCFVERFPVYGNILQQSRLIHRFSLRASSNVCTPLLNFKSGETPELEIYHQRVFRKLM